MSLTRFKYTLPAEVAADTFTWQKTVRYQRLKDNFDAAYALYQGTEEEVLVQITKNFESGLRYDRALFSVPYQASPVWSGVKTLVDNPLKFALFLGMVLQNKTAKDIRRAYLDFSSKKADTRLIEAALWACSDQQIVLAPKKVLVKEGTQWVLKDPSGQQSPSPLSAPSQETEPQVVEAPEVVATEDKEEPVVVVGSASIVDTPEPEQNSENPPPFELVVEDAADEAVVVEGGIETHTPEVSESLVAPLVVAPLVLPEAVVLPVVDMATLPSKEPTPLADNPSAPEPASDAPFIVGLDNLAGLPQLKADITEILHLVKIPPLTLGASLQEIDAKLQGLIDTPPSPVQTPVDLSTLIAELRQLNQAVKPLLGLPDTIKELKELMQRSSDEIKIEIHRVKSEAMMARRDVENLSKDLTDKTSTAPNSQAPSQQPPKSASGDSFLDSLAFLKGHGAKLNLSIGD
jgi:hypothetical protein